MVLAGPGRLRRQHGLPSFISQRTIGEHIIRVGGEAFHSHITAYAVRTLDNAHDDLSLSI